MKPSRNIHILPTDKPSRLAYDFYEKFYLLSEDTQFFEFQNLVQNRELYITSDVEIKDKCYVLSSTSIGALYLDGVINTASMLAEEQWKKVVLTTDQDLIEDGVQSIDDEFLEWFVKNPSCEEVKTQLKLPWESSKDEYEIIIPKEERSYSEEKFKQEILEEAAKNYVDYCACNISEDEDLADADKRGFIYGAKWQQERSYSEEEVYGILMKFFLKEDRKHIINPMMIEEWFKQFKKL